MRRFQRPSSARIRAGRDAATVGAQRRFGGQYGAGVAGAGGGCGAGGWLGGLAAGAGFGGARTEQERSQKTAEGPNLLMLGPKMVGNCLFATA